LFCVEASQVLFLHRLTVTLDDHGSGGVPLPAIWLEACEPQTVGVFAAVGHAEPCAASIEEDRAVTVSGGPLDTVDVTVCGVRKGMTERLKTFPPEVAKRNNAFWRQAWGG